MDISTTHFAIASLSGLIPALFWLWFWLREDKAHPEPKILIATSFLAGMLVVPLVFPVQQFAVERFFGTNLIVVWVIIEEVFKYAAALIVILWNKAVNEPIDTVIYMIVIALGFSALENALFIFNPLQAGDYLGSFLTGNLRFLGATLLHVLSSATVGIAMALSFYKRSVTRVFVATLGLCMAIILHALFNLFIIEASGSTILSIFMFVWMGIVVLFFIFEKIKLLEKKHRRTL